MVKHRKQKFMKKTSDNDFWNAVKDIRKLTYESLSKRDKRIEAKSKGTTKNTKTPINILKGIRQKALSKHKEKQQELRQNEVLYDSTIEKLDLAWHDKKKHTKEKRHKQHEYNSYKYKDANKRGVGKYSHGVLKLSKNDIKRISKS